MLHFYWNVKCSLGAVLEKLLLYLKPLPVAYIVHFCNSKWTTLVMYTYNALLEL